MKESHDIKATVVGDANKELGCFEEKQIYLIYVWREVNYYGSITLILKQEGGT